jgi:hypothetical protein
LAKSKAQNNASQCFANLQSLARAIHTYSLNHNGTLPPMDSWCDALLPSLAPNDFACPSAPRLKSAYALNASLANLQSTNITPDTVLLFESNQGWNASGGPHDLITTRHPHGIHIGFANGSAERVPAWQIPQLKWLPGPIPTTPTTTTTPKTRTQVQNPRWRS